MPAKGALLDCDPRSSRTPRSHGQCLENGKRSDKSIVMEWDRAQPYAQRHRQHAQQMSLEDLQPEEGLLHALLDTLPLGILIHRRDAPLIFNRRAEEILGGQLSPTDGWAQYARQIRTVYGAHIRERDLFIVRALHQGVSVGDEDLVIACPGGARRRVLASAAPLRDSHDEVIAAVGVLQDVTELRCRASGVRTPSQICRAARQREEALAFVAHDLRNPLMALMALANTTQRAAPDCSVGRRIRASMATMTEIVERTSGLVDDLLAVSVDETAGASMLRLEPVQALALLIQAVEPARLLVERSGLTLDVQWPDELPAIQVDRDRVLRVFANLVDNAIKFTQRPGSITLGARACSDGVMYTVANSGTPLSTHELGALFRPFWQARGDQRGAGIGLSICRSIVEAHGGKIWAEPADGQCMRACFVLPKMQHGALS